MKFLLAGLVVLAIIVLVVVRLLRGRFPTDPKIAFKIPADQNVDTRPNVGDIDALALKLEVDNKQSLFLMLAADGTVNRMGSGTMEDVNGGLFIGKIDPDIFEAVRAHVTQPMLAYLGQTFQNQSSPGTRYNLSVTFRFKDGTSNGLGFFCGSGSEGPPEDVATLMQEAVRRTDPWYENFKQNAAKQNP